MKRILALFIFFALATGSLSAQEVTPETPAAYWWNDRVFYEIFVRSFYDSDGDGTGDLRGVIEKLDYLNDGDPSTTDDLGITGIWLMPVMPSPSYHGYDVTDYYNIDEDYGTLDDMRALISAAHERGIAVIIDLVMNHTARANPWFTASAMQDPQYADFYLWRDTPPTWRGPDGQVVWHPYLGRFYYALFYDGMPDLNYTDPDVTAAMYDVNRFWLDDIGVDGFRLDAIKHLIEEGETQEDTPATHAWLSAYDNYIDSLDPHALTVGEAWTNIYNASDYVEDGEVDLVFEFDLAGATLSSAAQSDNADVASLQRQVNDQYPPNQYAAFLANHDQDRVIDQLRGDTNTARVAASLLLTGGGVPFIYYGEEIGMSGVKPDERIRTPMQWDATRATAGFTTDDHPWQPLSTGNEDGISVAAQTGDPDSLLSHYRDLIALRNANPALQQGSLLPVDTRTDEVYAFVRRSDEQTLLVVLNLSGDAITDYTLRLREGLTLTQPNVIYGEPDGFIAPTLDERGGFREYTPLPSLPPYSLTVITL